jgi:hypothetical protein
MAIPGLPAVSSSGLARDESVEPVESSGAAVELRAVDVAAGESKWAHEGDFARVGVELGLAQPRRVSLRDMSYMVRRDLRAEVELGADGVRAARVEARPLAFEHAPESERRFRGSHTFAIETTAERNLPLDKAMDARVLATASGRVEAGLGKAHALFAGGSVGIGAESWRRASTDVTTSGMVEEHGIELGLRGPRSETRLDYSVTEGDEMRMGRAFVVHERRTRFGTFYGRAIKESSGTGRENADYTKTAAVELGFTRPLR